MPQKPHTGDFNLKHWEGDLSGGDAMTEQSGSYFNLSLGDFSLTFPKRPNIPGIDPEDPSPADIAIGEVRWDFDGLFFVAWNGDEWEQLDLSGDPEDPTNPFVVLFLNLAVGVLRFAPSTTKLQRLVAGVWTDVVFPTSDPGGYQIWLGAT